MSDPSAIALRVYVTSAPKRIITSRLNDLRDATVQDVTTALHTINADTPASPEAYVAWAHDEFGVSMSANGGIFRVSPWTPPGQEITREDIARGVIGDLIGARLESGSTEPITDADVRKHLDADSLTSFPLLTSVGHVGHSITVSDQMVSIDTGEPLDGAAEDVQSSPSFRVLVSTVRELGVKGTIVITDEGAGPSVARFRI